MDSYQAIYDATRSRISSCNVQDAIVSVMRNAFDVSHLLPGLIQDIACSFAEHGRPSAVFRPALTCDGSVWTAVYGDLITGVIGIGDSPEAAMRDFDIKWTTKVPVSQE